MYKQYRSIVLASLVLVSGLAASAPAFASVEGRKNTAIVLTGATVYSYLKKDNRTALVGALASAAAWKNYEDGRKHESKQKAQARARYYRQHHPRGHAYGYYKNHKHNHR